MDVAAVMRLLPDPVLNALVRLVNSVGPLRRWISRKSINRYASATPPRPRPFTMAGDYTTWPSLTDRRYSGRHLPVAREDAAPKQPDIEEVVKLFRRSTFKPARDTSLLFPFFAQWFVDSFLRTKWEEGQDRRFRENESNHEIDLCQIYGVSDVQTTMLREGKGGRLRSQQINGEEWPVHLYEDEDGKPVLGERYRRKPEVDEVQPAVPGLYTPQNLKRVFENWSDEEKRQAFAVGLEHGNSTLANASMNTLFLREHNRTAGILAAEYPEWRDDDERLFQIARNVTMVLLLNIVVSDYIVHIAPIDFRLEAVPGDAEKQSWYRNNWIAVEFALLYRWHDLIPDEFTVGGETFHSQRMLRANALLIEKGLGQVLLDASRQHAGRMGLHNTAGFLIDPPADVKRMSIRMSRACGLPGYNDYRRYYGLKPIASFEALTRDPETAESLRSLYGSIDRLEWFVGLFAEGYGRRDMMGQLLTVMVANDAFTQALTNPLLAKAIHTEQTFTPAGLKIIRETRGIADLIARNTDLTDPSLFGFSVH